MHFHLRRLPLWILGGVFACGNLLAGNSAGGGGDAVVCRDSHHALISVQLFDYYEAKILGRAPIDLSSGATPTEKVLTALQRLVPLDPARASAYESQAKTFLSEAVLAPGISLTPIPDIHSVVLPANCGIEQLAVQQEPELPGDKRFTVAKDLWDAMTDVDRAGLILHEIVYREAIQYGHTDSYRARYLNELIASRALESMTPKKYAALLKELRLPSLTSVVGNFSLDQSTLEYFDSGAVAGGVLKEDGTLETKNGKFALGADTRVTFYESGAVKSGVLSWESKLVFKRCTYPLVSGTILEMNEDRSVAAIGNQKTIAMCELDANAGGTLGLSPAKSDGRFEFFPNGIVRAGILYKLWSYPYLSAPMKLPPGFYQPHWSYQSAPISKTESVAFTDGTAIEFYPNGLVRHGELGARYLLKTTARERRYFDGVVDFDEQGLVVVSD